MLILPILLHLTFAQAAPDISGVDAGFVKNFLIMSAFLAAMGGVGAFAYSRGKKASGQQDDPVHVHQPLTVTAQPQYAPKEETAAAIRAMNEKIDSMHRENVRQNQRTAEDINRSIQAGAERETKILNAIHESGQGIRAFVLEELKDVHERINPLQERVGKLEEAVKALRKHCDQIWEWVCKYLSGGKSK